MVTYCCYQVHVFLLNSLYHVPLLVMFINYSFKLSILFRRHYALSCTVGTQTPSGLGLRYIWCREIPQGSGNRSLPGARYLKEETLVCEGRISRS